MSKVSEIKLDPRNYRIHGEENKSLIRKSLTECGAGRSILVDKNDIVIAGNGVYEQAQELGLKVRVIDIEGFFEGADKVEHKKKVLVCPYCNKEIEV